LQDSIPDGLKTVTNGRVKIISDSLTTAHSTLKVLKDKVKTHKKSLNQTQTEDKKIK